MKVFPKMRFSAVGKSNFYICNTIGTIKNQEIDVDKHCFVVDIHRNIVGGSTNIVDKLRRIVADKRPIKVQVL